MSTQLIPYSFNTATLPQSPQGTVLQGQRQAGYIVVEWDDEVDTAFIDQLLSDSSIVDFCIYSVPCITDDKLCALEVV